MSTPESSTDRLDRVEDLLTQIAARQDRIAEQQEKTEQLGRTAIQAITASNKRYDKIDERLDRIAQMTLASADRIDKIELHFHQAGIRFDKIELHLHQVGIRFDKIELHLHQVGIRFDKIGEQFDKIRTNTSFLQTVVQGHITQPVPPAHPDE